MDLNLKDRHAIVCGASQGIGRAAAQALAAHGATITMIARDAAALEAVRLGLAAEHGQTHRYLTVDFERPEELRAHLATHLPGLAPVTILVNNTGGPAGGPASAAATDEYRRIFDRHLVCNQILVQAVLPAMRAARWGRIVNVISTSVKEPIKGLGVSNTIRGAVAAWAKTLSSELGPDGITVNNVLPGFTKTGRLDEVFKARMARSGATREAVEAEAKAEIPLGRFAEPREVADAILFLCSPAAGYVSGVSLPVDGGRMRSI
jgi:3-oxoacyl-[acyl-carrier protein] reductase